MLNSSERQALRDLRVDPAPSAVLALRPRPTPATHAGRWIELPQPVPQPRGRFRRYLKVIGVIFTALFVFLLVA